MTNYHNSKEMFTKIFHITNIHPTKHYRNVYKEKLNKVLDIMANEVTNEDNPYFANCGTTIKLAKFNVQIKLSKPSIWCGNCKVET
eukprot:13929144-Ditylum_brightwellii.AAC.1